MRDDGEGQESHIERDWRRLSFNLGIIGMVQGLILLPVAVLSYAGGHLADPAAPGFSMLYNFFSDLGRVVAYSGLPNTLSSVVFNSSLFLTGALLIPYFAAFPRLFKGTRESLWFSVMGSIIGIFFALTFVGGALTPSDLFRDIHLMFGALAFVSGLPIVVFHIFAILGKPEFPNRYTLVYMALGIILGLFLYAMLQAGTNELSLTVTIGQKAVVVSILICFLILSYGARRILDSIDASASSV
jgi:hypothetical membrane protein